jgi:hypothetical protein
MRWLAATLLIVGATLMTSSYLAWRLAHNCDDCVPTFNGFMTALLVAGAVLFAGGCVVLVVARRQR